MCYSFMEGRRNVSFTSTPKIFKLSENLKKSHNNDDIFKLYKIINKKKSK